MTLIIHFVTHYPLTVYSSKSIQVPVQYHLVGQRQKAFSQLRRAMYAALAFSVLGSLSAYSFAAEVLPLKHGIYVDSSQSCKSPANAGIRQYDGSGLNTAHTHGCVLQVRAKKGINYVLAQRCIDAGTGKAPFVDEEMNVSVLSEEKFLLKKGKTSTRFHYCSSSATNVGGAAAD